MALETGSYLADLNTTNPAGTDPKSQGDDHIRLLKAVLKNSFAGFPGAVVVTGAEAQGATANDYVVTVTPAPAAYSAWTVVVFKAAHANTGAATLRVGALAAKALKAVDGGALEAGDIESGALCAAVYDGTDFLLASGNDRAARGGDSYTGVHDFTAGTVRAATQAAGDNSTKAASTAYVDAAAALKANPASPALTGAPTAPTAAPGTNTTQIATTAFATQLAFQAALPVQTGNAEKALFTNGSAAAWRGAFTGDSGAGGAAGVVPAPAAGDASKFLKGNGTWALSPSAPDIIVEDQKSSGTPSAIYASGAWRDRELNTLVRNNGSIGTLSGNILTLPPGTWLIRARAVVSYQSLSGGSGPAAARARVFNVTDGSVAGQGLNATYATNGEGSSGVSEVVAVVSTAAAKDFKLQVYCNQASLQVASIGTGQAEVYSRLEATRLSL